MLVLLIVTDFVDFGRAQWEETAFAHGRTSTHTRHGHQTQVRRVSPKTTRWPYLVYLRGVFTHHSDLYMRERGSPLLLLATFRQLGLDLGRLELIDFVRKIGDCLRKGCCIRRVVIRLFLAHVVRVGRFQS